MRDRSNVFNRVNFQTCSLKCTDCCFTPAPGPFTYTSTCFKPCSIAALVASSAAICAANGVLLRLPRKPRPPAEAQLRTLPSVSAMVTIVLLKVERICATPLITFLLTFFLLRTTSCQPLVYPPSLIISSCLQ